MQTQQIAYDLQTVNAQNSAAKRSNSVFSHRKNNDSQVRLASDGNMPDHTQDHNMGHPNYNNNVSAGQTMVLDEVYGEG